MDRKAFLAFGTKGLALAGLVATAYPFVASMSPSEKAINDSIVAVTLPSLELGVVYSVDVDGHALFLLKPSEDQLAAIHALDSHVWDVSTNAYRADLGVYVYWGHPLAAPGQPAISYPEELVA